MWDRYPVVAMGCPLFLHCRLGYNTSLEAIFCYTPDNYIKITAQLFRNFSMDCDVMTRRYLRKK